MIDADGPSAVSLRSMASVLGVDAKSLYNQVADEEGLLDAVAETGPCSTPRQRSWC